MRYIKLLLALAGLLGFSVLGLGFYAKTSGGAVMEMYEQTDINAGQITFKQIHSFEHRGNKWLYKEFFKNNELKDLMEDIETVKFKATNGYELVVFDNDNNKLGVLEYLILDKNLNQDSFNADFDFNNYLTKDFKVTPIKIKK